MTKEEPKPQSLLAKKAESKRPYHGYSVIEDPNIGGLFRDRADTMLADLKWLEQNWEVQFSPFLEIGAGSVQRSAALLNNYPVQGVATDISINSLKDAPHVLSLLKYDRLPILICCDAHYIPFLPNSFNFVFAYQTFHHFENPKPVFTECFRILARGGHLFFNEEPLDSSFRRMLRGERLLSHPPTRIQKFGYRLGVEKVFWDDGALERSLGMTEARFDLDLWCESLEPFTILDIEVNRKLKIHSILKKSALNTILSGFVGGNVKGLCVKKEGEYLNGDFHDRLMCLDCYSSHIKLLNDRQMKCENCQRIYAVSDGVMRMFPKHLEDELFPENQNREPK